MDGHPVAGQIPVVSVDNPSDRLEKLFDTHHERLYRLARRLVSSRDDALDLVQETFLRAARSTVPSGNTNEEAWLVRVLVNVQRDQWRKVGVRQRYQSEVSAPQQNAESSLLARTAVWQALDQLHPRRRAVLVMYELEGLAVPIIAGLLGLSGITVRWHLTVGRREMARILKPHIGDSK